MHSYLPKTCILIYRNVAFLFTENSHCYLPFTTDCRAFIKNPENIYSQPAKCTYNPYIAKWQGEEDYMSVAEWRNLNPEWEAGTKRRPLVNIPQSVD